MSLEPVINILTAYNPKFARKDYQPVFAWLSEGADMEQDILPMFGTGRPISPTSTACGSLPLSC